MEHIQDYHVQGDYNTRMIQMRNDKFRDDIKWPTSLTLQSILLCVLCREKHHAHQTFTLPSSNKCFQYSEEQHKFIFISNAKC